MTNECPWVTCYYHSKNKDTFDSVTNMGYCKKENVTLMPPDEVDEFKDVDWGEIEPQDLLVCTDYQRNWND